MHVSAFLLYTLLPLTLAHAVVQPAHRRHNVRSVVQRDGSIMVVRAGAPVDNSTLSSISAMEAGVAASASSTSPVTTSSSPSSSASSQAIVTASSSDVPAASTSSVISTSSSSFSAAEPLSTSLTTIIAQPTTSAAAPITASSTSMSTSIAVVEPTAVASSATIIAPTTLSGPLSSSAFSNKTTIVTKSAAESVTTISSTASTPSHTSAADSSTTKTSGLSKTTLIAIIAVAAVIGMVAIGFTAFRKWKLKPSNRFDDKMKPLNFSHHNDGMDDFLEKTLQRSTSHSSLDRQRQMLVSELDGNGVAGIPQHDFTAGSTNMAGHGVYDPNVYNQDPYAHAEQYEYDANYHSYPPAPGQGDYPTQDQPLYEGYADLQRGTSLGSGSGHGHAQHTYPTENAFPDPANYLGRPTGGSDGPYAQAAQYRGY